MRKAFFLRVEGNTTFSSLVTGAKKQMDAGHKPLNYSVVAEIYLPKKEFDKVMDNISFPLLQYRACCRKSVTSSEGVWQCLKLKCLFDVRAAVVYMAGRSFPLYAAPIL